MTNLTFKRMQYFIIAFGLIMAGGIWFVMLRPVPIRKAIGTVVAKTYKEPGDYTQVHGGARASFHGATSIPVAEGYVLDIEVDDGAGHVNAWVNSSYAELYKEGGRVEFEYQVRSVPGIWSRVYVINLEPHEE